MIYIPKHKFLWRPDHPSSRPWYDHEVLLRLTGPAPDKTNNRPIVQGIPGLPYDQGQEGSCTANSAIATQRYVRAVNHLPDFPGSRQFQYQATLTIAGTPGQDVGASIAQAVEAESTYGSCLESTVPYSTALSEAMPDNAIMEAAQHKVLARAPVQQNQDALEACLAAQQPIQFGITAFQSLESPETMATGVIQMPRLFDRPIGGHSLWMFDYDRTQRVAYGLQSWLDFGVDGNGIFTIPYDYILDADLCSDWWTVSGVQV